MHARHVRKQPFRVDTPPAWVCMHVCMCGRQASAAATTWPRVIPVCYQRALLQRKSLFAAQDTIMVFLEKGREREKKTCLSLCFFLYSGSTRRRKQSADLKNSYYQYCLSYTHIKKLFFFIEVVHKILASRDSLFKSLLLPIGNSLGGWLRAYKRCCVLSMIGCRDSSLKLAVFRWRDVTHSLLVMAKRRNESRVDRWLAEP